MNILHISAHLGGGAGKAISGIAIGRNCPDESHRIVILEAPEKTLHADECEKHGISVRIYEKKNLNDYLEWADVLIVSWWNHPRMAEFLYELSGRPCRVIIWFHVNGNVYPYISHELVRSSDKLMFTTPYSLEAFNGDNEIQSKSCVVNGMGDFHPEKITPKTNYARGEKFIVGYVGTLNYAKLNKRFFEYCKAAAERVPNIEFMLVGSCWADVAADAEKYGLKDKVNFVGYTDNVYPYLEKMDIFGYLLNPDNYATTENALLEAMALGIPAVVCDNKPESYIIENNINGFHVSSPEEYAQITAELAAAEELRERLGKAARAKVISKYSVEKNKAVFGEAVADTMKYDKTAKDFRSFLGNTPWEWFLSCTGRDRAGFEELFPIDSEEKEHRTSMFLRALPPIYREISKSSIAHFQRCYPDDKKLAYLTGRLRESGGETPGGKRQPLAENLPLEMPYLVQIFPFYGCNFRCGYCLHSLPKVQHGYISDKTVMDMELFEKIVDDIKASGKRIRMMRFAAIGEPLLNKEIARMVAYAKKADIADGVDIVTNGSLLTRELSDALIAAGLTRLRVSLEGLTDEAYKANASANVNLSDMTENLRYFYEHCKETRVYVKIIDYMVKTPEERERFFSTFGPVCHTMAIEHLTPTIEEIDYDTLSDGQKNDRPQNGEQLLSAKVCPQPFYMMQINPDGSVVPCCSMRYPEILGNVYENSVMDIWRGGKYNSLRQRLLDGTANACEVCAKCTLYRYDLHREDMLDADAERLKGLY